MPRTKGSRNIKPCGVRISPTIRPEVKKWIDEQPLSQGQVINNLAKEKIWHKKAKDCPHARFDGWIYCGMLEAQIFDTDGKESVLERKLCCGDNCTFDY